MSDELVKIKGGSTGLSLSFREGAAFTDIQASLTEKLESGTGFFLRGTLVLLPRGVFSEDEAAELKRLFHAYGLICRLEPLKSEAPEEPQQPPVVEEPKAEAKPQTDTVQEMMVVNRTLRGGQEIRTQSSVLVLGNVNPGSQIIAGGSIDVRGTCRGLVHAGAFGDTSAIIVADHLMPTQIRIAGLIARSPDQQVKAEKAERASIKDGQIVIEPIER